MEGDLLARELPQNVRVVTGDVCDEAALGRFFAGADEHTCVIHCAGIISVATHPGDRIYRVNVDGTRNILKFCSQCGVGKLVYVSSVHAIPEKPKGTEIAETTVFSPELVRGDYAKSKAMATALALQAAKDSGAFRGDKGDPGEKGEPGAPGKTPVRGTDYWTVADKQEIVNSVIAALPDGTEVSY